MKYLTTRICSGIVKAFKAVLDEYANTNGIIIDPEVTIRQPSTQENSFLKLLKSSPLKPFASTRQRQEDLTKLHYAILATHLHYDDYITNIEVILKTISKGLSSLYSKDGSTLKKGLRRKIEDVNKRAISFYDLDFKTLETIIQQQVERLVHTASDIDEALLAIQEKLKIFCEAILQRNERMDLLFCPRRQPREGLPDTDTYEKAYAALLIRGLVLREAKDFQHFLDMIDLEITIANEQKAILDEVHPSNMKFLDINAFERMLVENLKQIDEQYRLSFQPSKNLALELSSTTQPKTKAEKKEITPEVLEEGALLYKKALQFEEAKAHEYARQNIEKVLRLVGEHASTMYYALAAQIYISCFKLEKSDLNVRKNYLKQALKQAKLWCDCCQEDEEALKAAQECLQYLTLNYGCLLVQIALSLPISTTEEDDTEENSVTWESVVGAALRKNPIFQDHLLCTEDEEVKLVEQLKIDLNAYLAGLNSETVSKEMIRERLESAAHHALNIWIREIQRVESSTTLLGKTQIFGTTRRLAPKLGNQKETETLHLIQTQALTSYQLGRSDTLYLIFYTSLASFIRDLFESYTLAQKGAMRRPEEPTDQVNNYIRGAMTHGRSMFGPEVTLTMLGINKAIDWWQDSSYEQRAQYFLYSAGSKEEIELHLSTFKKYIAEKFTDALKYVDPEGIINLLNAAKERIVEYAGRRKHESPASKVWLDGLSLGQSKNFDHLSVPLQYTENGLTKRENMRIPAFLKHPDQVATLLAQSFKLSEGSTTLTESTKKIHML